MQLNNTDFELEKWYLDCVTESGEAFIGYAGLMRWKKLKVPYSSTIFLNNAQDVTVKTRLSNPTYPILKDTGLTWSNPNLKISGHWEKQERSLEAELHTSKHGSLIWNCYQPKSKSKIVFQGNFYSGYGYAEKLRLTDMPWRIDMNSLRWGRYISLNENLVWIQIKGSTSRQWLWYNGVKIDNSIISDNEILIPVEHIALTLSDKRVIESEQKILNTVRKLIKYLPGFDKIIPIHFLNADEIKWCSKAKLYYDDKLKGEGWAIHEYVDFNKTNL